MMRDHGRMHDPRILLGDIAGGRVLDVATGTGGFVGTMLECLASVGEIVGIDANPARGDAFRTALADRPRVRFEVMDANALAFADGWFDLVAVSNSLHHFPDPAPVLAEMLRVLRPGGWFVVNEMYRDGQTPQQETHVLMHHWWAAVNTLRGEVHRETYERAGILAILAGLGLADPRVADLADLESDPLEPAALADLDPAIDQYLELAAGHADLVARGLVLRERLHSVGVHGATQLLAVGRRP
jgi:SAM-dependent methyltransferase